MTGPAVPVGRGAEAAEIEDFLDGLTTGSRTRLLEGEVGIGKTTLVDWSRQAAGTRGFTVLSASPVEAEFPLEFAGLADLLDSVDPAVVDALPVPQLHAIRAAVLRQEQPSSPVDARTIATATLTVLRTLAATAPVVIVVDDLAWLDLPSARVVSFVLRRARQARLGLLASARTDWSGEPPPIPALDDADPARIDRVRVGPLSIGAMRALLQSRTGLTPDRARLRRLHEASGGNPLFALELAVATAADGAGQADSTLSVPRSLRDLVLDRISTLTAGQRDVLLATALTTEPTATLIRAAAANPTAGAEDLDLLIGARILGRRGDRVVFSHPLLRSVVASEAEPGQRRRAHRRLATNVDLPEARARHLALGTVGPDETVAGEVESAAELAAARGACEIAADLADLAFTLTPEKQKASRRRRMVLEAEYRFEASDPARACSLIQSVVDDVEPGPYRAELLRRLARYRSYCGEPVPSWTATLLAALEQSGDNMALRAEILQDLGVAASNGGDQVAGFEYGLSALDLAERSGNRALAAQLSAGLAWAHFISGEGVRQDLIDRAMRGPPQPVRLAMELRPGVVVGHLLHMSDDLDTARSLYERDDEVLRDAGVETGRPLLLWGLVETEAYAGNWDRAGQLAAEGHQLAEDAGSLVGTMVMAATSGLVHVYRGRLEEGRRDGERALELAEALALPLFSLLVAQSMGLARLSVGDARGAHDCLGSFAEAVLVAGIGEPAVVRFLPDEIEALIRLGDLEAAARLLDPFEARSVELSRGWGIAAAWRCRGLFLAASGDSAGAETKLSEALAVHQRLAMPFEEARTLLVAGEVHRRARHKSLAESRLQAALAIFDRLGAPLWVQRARAELDHLGLRRAAPSAGSGLTAVERRVADLVAAGHANAQVAAQLFMAVRTVEAHLSCIYRKLGVASRTEMVHVLLAQPAQDPGTSGPASR